MKSLPDVKTATDLPAQLNNSPSSFLDGFAGEKLPLMKDTTILKIVGSLPSSNSPAVTGDLELPLLGGSLPDIISRGAHTSGKKVEPRGLQRVPLSCANDMKNPFVPPFAVESIHPQLDDDALHLTDKGLQRVPLSRANDVKNPFVPPFAVESLQLDDDALHLTDKGRGIKRQGQVLLATVNEAKGEEEAYRPFKVPRKATQLMEAGLKLGSEQQADVLAFPQAEIVLQKKRKIEEVDKLPNKKRTHSGSGSGSGSSNPGPSSEPSSEAGWITPGRKKKKQQVPQQVSGPPPRTEPFKTRCKLKYPPIIEVFNPNTYGGKVWMIQFLIGKTMFDFGSLNKKLVEKQTGKKLWESTCFVHGGFEMHRSGEREPPLTMVPYQSSKDYIKAITPLAMVPYQSSKADIKAIPEIQVYFPEFLLVDNRNSMWEGWWIKHGYKAMKKPDKFMAQMVKLCKKVDYCLRRGFQGMLDIKDSYWVPTTYLKLEEYVTIPFSVQTFIGEKIATQNRIKSVNVFVTEDFDVLDCHDSTKLLTKHKVKFNEKPLKDNHPLYVVKNDLERRQIC